MTLMEARPRVPAARKVAVRVVDAGVHPVPQAGELTPHIAEPYRSRSILTHPDGETINFDAPGHADAMATRADTFQADGNFPGSDPELAYRQLILQAGSDIGILEPAGRSHFIPEVNSALMAALNHWQHNHWLDSTGNWHQRWRGSICVAVEDPDGAAREVEEWAGHPYMAQVLIKAEPRPAWGDPKYDPLWGAAVRHDLPVSCRLSRGYHALAANQVMSLVFDGVFERFPTLKIVLVEHAFNWILPMMWGLDAVYEARRSDFPEVRRKPSEYIKDHIKFTTQPLDYPLEDKQELTNAFEWMEGDKILLFSSDYPHWTFGDPRWLVKHLPERMSAAVMHGNGIETYRNVPREVTALEGQTRVP
jgi:predicted TIM-barrel fold metal-dependent hydrolase